jgi:hypothetical protein
MKRGRVWLGGVWVVGVSCILVVAAQAAARPAPQAPRAEQKVAVPVQPPAAPPAAAFDEQDASRVRERLAALLQRYPPALGSVLKLDPTLLSNQTYLAPYPAVSAFLAQHPEVTRNPEYFFSRVPLRGSGSYYLDYVPDRQTEAINAWRGMMGAFAAIFVFIVVTALLAWLVKTLIDYRRWVRLSKVQTEAHTKLLDRFTANQDLLAYVQTPAGQRFLESAPIALDTAHGEIAMPLRRVLWAVQAGLVLATLAGGLLFVSSRVDPLVASPVFSIGILTLSLGIGFILAAVVSFVLARRFGLVAQQAAPDTTPR